MGIELRELRPRLGVSVKNRTWSMTGAGWICLALGLITLVAFTPALRHAFLVYDDQQYVTENAHVKAGLAWPSVVWAFKSFYAANWHPLTWLSHELDCQLFGLRPWGHHLTNVLLHGANTVLLFLLLNRLTGAVRRSAVVAALFGWHPLHVESVAWVAERKDVLSAFFFMLTLWAYERYAQQTGDRRWKMEYGRPAPDLAASHLPASIFYLLSLLFFALGLMSKPMLVTLPFVLLLLAYWPLRRLEIRNQKSEIRNLFLEKIPFLALSAVDCALTVAAQQPTMVSRAGLSVPARAEHALVAYVHYLGALFVPHRMAVYYPYQKTLPAGEVVLAGLFLALLTALVFWKGILPVVTAGARGPLLHSRRSEERRVGKECRSRW